MEAQLLQTTLKKIEGGGAPGEMNRVNVSTGGVQENRLDLRLGISLNGFGHTGAGGGPTAAKGGGGRAFASAATGSLYCGGSAGAVPPQQARVCSVPRAKRWFSEAVGGFVDPWSLAARQETAVLEQRTLAYRRNVNPTSSHTVPSTSTPSPVVGWPPIRAFRKNMVSTPSHPKPEMDMEKDLKRTKPLEGDHTPTKLDINSTMFVKVNMEGYNVGRKIDLMAHSSYDSLSCALQKMFHNFLSVSYPVSHSNNTKHNAKDEAVSGNYVLLYEDNEGDQMLVGDVPWEMFISSVKRLYIVNGSKDPKIGDGRTAENNKSWLFENEVKVKG